MTWSLFSPMWIPAGSEMEASTDSGDPAAERRAHGGRGETDARIAAGLGFQRLSGVSYDV